MPAHEIALMLRVRDGDSAAFAEIYRLYQKPLANYLYRLCWNRRLVDDLMQEVFLRLWRAAPNYEPTAKVSTYIFRIAHNLRINEGMKKREDVMSELDRVGLADPARGMELHETQRAVQQAVQDLPDGERECLVLSEYHGLKYAEISEVVGIPIGTVKSRIFSAMKRLRERLKDVR